MTKRAADELRSQTEEAQLTILGDAVEWATNEWESFMTKMTEQACKGLRSVRHIILPANAPEDVHQQAAMLPVEMLKQFPTPLPKQRARFAALMARAEVEGFKVQRLAPCAWEVSW